MNSVQKKLEDLERLKKEMSDKLDKYEYHFNKNNEKIDLSILKQEKDENKNNNVGEKNFKQIMNQRLDEIMGKIDDKIINQNYSYFYKFLSKASPYQKNKSQKIQQNPENKSNSDSNNNSNNYSYKNNNKNSNKVTEIKEQENSEENYDDFNNEEEINKIENDIPKEDKKDQEEKEREKLEKEEKEKIVEEIIEKKRNKK